MSLGAGATLSGEAPDRMPLGVALLDDLVGGATALDEACEVSGRMPPHGDTRTLDADGPDRMPQGVPLDEASG